MFLYFFRKLFWLKRKNAGPKLTCCPLVWCCTSFRHQCLKYGSATSLSVLCRLKGEVTILLFASGYTMSWAGPAGMECGSLLLLRFGVVSLMALTPFAAVLKSAKVPLYKIWQHLKRGWQSWGRRFWSGLLCLVLKSELLMESCTFVIFHGDFLLSLGLSKWWSYIRIMAVSVYTRGLNNHSVPK